MKKQMSFGVVFSMCFMMGQLVQAAPVEVRPTRPVSEEGAALLKTARSADKGLASFQNDHLEARLSYQPAVEGKGVKVQYESVFVREDGAVEHAEMTIPSGNENRLDRLYRSSIFGKTFGVKESITPIVGRQGTDANGLILQRLYSGKVSTTEFYLTKRIDGKLVFGSADTTVMVGGNKTRVQGEGGREIGIREAGPNQRLIDVPEKERLKLGDHQIPGKIVDLKLSFAPNKEKVITVLTFQNGRFYETDLTEGANGKYAVSRRRELLNQEVRARGLLVSEPKVIPGRTATTGTSHGAHVVE